MTTKKFGDHPALVWALLATAFIMMGVLFSCEGPTQRTSVTVTKTNEDSLVVATVEVGSIPDSINLQVDHSFQRVHLVIKGISSTDSLVAILHAAGKERNIRINQIMMPDGTMDGPFGNMIRYETKQKGDYTLIIGKDNMADGRLTGPVAIQVKLF